MASTTEQEDRLRALYQQLLDSWNRRDDHAFAVLFEVKDSLIGYDSSQINRRSAIQVELERIFHNHIPATCVAKVREVRFVTSEVASLRAVAGMIPRGQTELDPNVIAVQTLTAVKRDGKGFLIFF